MSETEQKKLRLLRLAHELKVIAAPVGSMHSYWDVASDIERHIRGQETIVKQTTDEWIEYAEKLIAESKS